MSGRSSCADAQSVQQELELEQGPQLDKGKERQRDVQIQDKGSGLEASTVPVSDERTMGDRFGLRRARDSTNSGIYDGNDENGE